VALVVAATNLTADALPVDVAEARRLPGIPTALVLSRPNRASGQTDRKKQVGQETRACHIGAFLKEVVLSQDSKRYAHPHGAVCAAFHLDVKRGSRLPATFTAATWRKRPNTPLCH
jgi:hypothetical protein